MSYETQLTAAESRIRQLERDLQAAKNRTSEEQNARARAEETLAELRRQLIIATLHESLASAAAVA